MRRKRVERKLDGKFVSRITRRSSTDISDLFLFNSSNGGSRIIRLIFFYNSQISSFLKRQLWPIIFPTTWRHRQPSIYKRTVRLQFGIVFERRGVIVQRPASCTKFWMQHARVSSQQSEANVCPSVLTHTCPPCLPRRSIPAIRQIRLRKLDDPPSSPPPHRSSIVFHPPLTGPTKARSIIEQPAFLVFSSGDKFPWLFPRGNTIHPRNDYSSNRLRKCRSQCATPR